MAKNSKKRTSRAAQTSRDYDVGYKKPPSSGQFRRGHSGNPRGRPKGRKNFKTDLEEELFQTIQVNESGSLSVITKQRALIKRMLERALKGDVKAGDLVFRWLANVIDLGHEWGVTNSRVSSSQRP